MTIRYSRLICVAVTVALAAWCSESNSAFAQGSFGGSSGGWGSSGGFGIGGRLSSLRAGGSSGGFGYGSSGGFSGAWRSRIGALRPSFGSSGGSGFGSSGGWSRPIFARTSFGSTGSLLGGGSSGGFAWGSRFSGFGSGGSTGGWSRSFRPFAGGSTGSYISFGSGGGSVGTYAAYGSAGSSLSATYSSAIVDSVPSVSSPVTSYSIPSGHIETTVPHTEFNPPVIQDPVPSAAPSSDPTPNPTPDPGAGATGDAVLNVEVPDDATVFVNDVKTTTPGTKRSYVSRDLQPGFKYTYEVRAEAIRDGKKVEQTKTIDLRVGASEKLVFDFSKSEKVVTSVTLRVPTNAKIELCGKKMTMVGPVRTFSTSRLAVGKTWKDYEIKVTYDVDGQQVSESKTLDINAGDKVDFTFGTQAQEQVAAK